MMQLMTIMKIMTMMTMVYNLAPPFFKIPPMPPYNNNGADVPPDIGEGPGDIPDDTGPLPDMVQMAGVPTENT